MDVNKLLQEFLDNRNESNIDEQTKGLYYQMVQTFSEVMNKDDEFIVSSLKEKLEHILRERLDAHSEN